MVTMTLPVHAWGRTTALRRPEDNSVISHLLHLHEGSRDGTGERARLACSILLALVEELCT